MALRCRKGDMAIIIKGAYSGYVVDVLQFIGCISATNSEGVLSAVDDAWLISVNSPLKGVHALRRVTNKVACDKYLLPIRPGGLRETEESERELTT
jgi:hypothetical protein